MGQIWQLRCYFDEFGVWSWEFQNLFLNKFKWSFYKLRHFIQGQRIYFPAQITNA